MYLLDVSIRYLLYFCVLFVLFVFLFMLLALLRCYTSIFDCFIDIRESMDVMYIQVRDETNKVQFGRMDKEQQEEMNEFKRPVLV